MKYLSIVISTFLSFSCFAMENTEQCSVKTKLLGDHKSVFVPGSIAPYRVADSSSNNLVAFRLTKSDKAKVLSKFGLKNGDKIIEICGVNIESAFKSKFDAPVCCNSEYPETLTIKVSRSLIEQFTVEIPKSEYNGT